MLCGDLKGKESQERRDTWLCNADSLCHTAETNTILKSKYTPIKINYKKASE